MEEKKNSFFQGLFAFLKEYSVIGLAIGVIVAQISKELIDSIVNGLFMPLIKLIVPGGDWQNLVFAIGEVRFDIGLIISKSLTFILIMTILYIVVKKILKQEDLIKKK